MVQRSTGDRIIEYTQKEIDHIISSTIDIYLRIRDTPEVQRVMLDPNCSANEWYETWLEHVLS